MIRQIYKSWISFALVCFLALRCSKNYNGIEAIISSNEGVGLFETIVLESGNPKEEIASYSWELVAFPEIIEGERVKKYTDKVSAQSYRKLRFLPPYAGDYSFKLTVVDIEGNKDTVTEDITIASLCDENYRLDTLWIETFENSNDWSFEIGMDDPNYCDWLGYFEAGISKIENDTLTLAPSTIEEFRTAKRDLTGFGFNKESNYKFTISLADTITKPYFHDFFFSYMKASNFSINILSYEIKIRMNEDPLPYDGEWVDFRRYFSFGERLVLYFRFDEENPVFFDCNDQLDKTVEFEVLNSDNNESFISFSAYNDDGEVHCDKINEVIIEEFYLD